MLARMWSNGNSHSLLLEMQNGTATLGNSLAVSYKAKRVLSHKSVIVLQGFYPTNLKTYVHTKSCT